MASDDIWILGINMTKFGKHPDKDVVDLASEAALAALDRQAAIEKSSRRKAMLRMPLTSRSLLCQTMPRAPPDPPLGVAAGV